MPKLLTIQLTSKQRQELEEVRDTHELGYMRERAAAILKIADGQSGLQVARQGLLKPRYRGTVYDWFHRYETEGMAGLKIKPGRGRKPAFFPSASRPGERS